MCSEASSPIFLAFPWAATAGKIISSFHPNCTQDEMISSLYITNKVISYTFLHLWMTVIGQKTWFPSDVLLNHPNDTYRFPSIYKSTIIPMKTSDLIIIILIPMLLWAKKHKHPNITNISSSQHSEKNWTPFLRNFFDEFIVPTSSHHDPPCSMALSIPIYIYIIINWRFFHPELLFRTAEDMVTWPAKLFNMLGNKCPYTSPNWCLNWSIH